MNRMKFSGWRSHKTQTVFIAFLTAGFFCGGALLLWAATLPIPDLESLETRKVLQSTKIYDRTGKIVLYDFHNDVQRTVIPFESISRNIKNATVAIEDAEFYQHGGIRPYSIARAVLADILIGLRLQSGFTQGGSTITQQVVKISVLTNDKTVTRKLKEWVLAIKLDKTLPKDAILNLYLNEAPYGGNIYGAEEASRAFFGVDAADLSLGQAAYLAAIPRAPTHYSPYGNYRSELDARKDLVLSKMLENGFISQSDYQTALKETVVFLPKAEGNIKAPHFVFYVREYLEKKYGDRALGEQGLKVITTIDYSLQMKAEEIVARYAKENEKNFNASNAALIAIDPKTGQILSMVGSRDYFDPAVDGNFNVAVARNRQPGSTFKPFVYATAFKKGYTPDTVVFDVPTQFQSTCAWDNFTSEDGCYSPQNFDEKFRGPIKLRNAIAESRNIPSVKVLYLAGIKDSLQTAADLGISSLSGADQYGLTLVLGGAQVSLLDLTSAYGVFANDGVRNPTTPILEITDGDGSVLETYAPSPQPALDPLIARQVSDILSDNEARAPEFGTDSPLYFPGRDVAAKTGTTNDYRDVWTIGYSPDIVVGVWGGNNDNTPIEKQIAGFVIAPMWHAFMEQALQTLQRSDFKKPDYSFEKNLKPILRGIWQGGTIYTVDTLSGKLATDLTPQKTREERAAGEVHSILYWVTRENPKGEAPSVPENDPQFRLWEPAVQAWLRKHGGTSSSAAPTAYDDIHTQQNMPTISFVSPAQGALFDRNSRLTARVSASGRFPISRVDYYLNDLFIGSSTQPPYALSFIPANIQTAAATNILSATVNDAVYSTATASVSFLLQ